MVTVVVSRRQCCAVFQAKRVDSSSRHRLPCAARFKRKIENPRKRSGGRDGQQRCARWKRQLKLLSKRHFHYRQNDDRALLPAGHRDLGVCTSMSLVHVTLLYPTAIASACHSCSVAATSYISGQRPKHESPIAARHHPRRSTTGACAYVNNQVR